MKSTRRDFIKAGTALGSVSALAARAAAPGQRHPEVDGRIRQAGEAPVLRRELFPNPVPIATIEVLDSRGEEMVRVRAKDGTTGLSVGRFLGTTWPILQDRIVPFFIGKDARDLDALIEGVYLEGSNYKWQGLPYWVAHAALEMAVLDLLGRVAGRPLGALFSEKVRRDVAVYRASGRRGNTPEEEIEYLQQLVAETGAKAIKFRLGAMMRMDEASTRRDLALIPLTRKVFGDSMTIYADANGSYDVPMSLRIGRLMQEHRLAFFEEPVPFDSYDETKQIADALPIPVAGGEQESSLRRFRWMVEHRCVDLVQPDLFYFGGFVRSIRVARMAAAAGMMCTPHMSGGGLGYLYAAHFMSCIPNPAAFVEYKGHPEELPVSSSSSPLKSTKGVLTVPSGPGTGVEIDPAFVRAAKSLLT